jgi:hypothetical protein
MPGPACSRRGCSLADSYRKQIGYVLVLAEIFDLGSCEFRGAVLMLSHEQRNSAGCRFTTSSAHAMPRVAAIPLSHIKA